jgi:hypothetical protein
MTEAERLVCRIDAAIPWGCSARIGEFRLVAELELRPEFVGLVEMVFDRRLRPVMKIMSEIPAAAASSTAY